MGWSFATASPTPVRSPVVPGRRFGTHSSLVQSLWCWFDQLSDVQTVALLSSTLVALLVLALALMRFPSSPSRSVAIPVTSGPSVAATADPPRSIPPDPVVAQPARAQTMPVRVNLRVAPGTGSALIETLAPSTELQLLGSRTDRDGTAWQQVRTDDGHEGWLIGDALEEGRHVR